MKPAVLSFSPGSAALAERLAAACGGTVHQLGSGEAVLLLRRLFSEGRPIVGICAAGILIRLLAGALADKDAEPPVLAVSRDGRFVVPLLGGHKGANRLARELAAVIGAEAALTTASESRFGRALDEPPDGWVLATPEAAKQAMVALLDGAAIALAGEASWLAEAGYPIDPAGAVRVAVTEYVRRPEAGLVYHPRTLVAGVGCERGADAEEVIGLIEATLAAQGLAFASLAAIASVELKADEPALHAAAARFGVPLRLFSVAELDEERARLATPSAVVEAEIGTPGVAEAAALKAGSLLLPKQKSRRATCAIGRASRPLEAAALGRAPGELHLVGIGPGDAATRTVSAVAALERATDWVGYGLYLDLVADLHTSQTEHRFPLGAEEDRVRHALELAGQGRRVALVCSGDAQIYAMAALVYELLAATGPRAVSDAATRVAVVSHPGISALQAASAAAGALLGHDFCAISLSDLLTPRAEIERRLEAAARADFVTAFYNPRSQRRTDLIELARATFLAHRPAGTPVVVASNLGRPEQRVAVVPLVEFDPEKVDMLTIVLVGASTSQLLQRGDGRSYAFTPRGYARKAQSGETVDAS